MYKLTIIDAFDGSVYLEDESESIISMGVELRRFALGAYDVIVDVRNTHDFRAYDLFLKNMNMRKPSFHAFIETV